MTYKSFNSKSLSTIFYSVIVMTTRIEIFVACYKDLSIFVHGWIALPQRAEKTSLQPANVDGYSMLFWAGTWSAKALTNPDEINDRNIFIALGEESRQLWRLWTPHLKLSVSKAVLQKQNLPLSYIKLNRESPWDSYSISQQNWF